MTRTVLGIIGGSGVYDIAGLENPRWKRVESPWGEASDELLFGIFKGVDLVFLPRHGRGHIQSGRIRALAVSTAKRPQAIPGLPTVAESGIPGYDAGVWYAVLAPAGTPPAIIDRLNREMAAALERPDYAKLLRDSAIDPVGSTPAELGAYIGSEISKWAKVVREAGVHID